MRTFDPSGFGDMHGSIPSAAFSVTSHNFNADISVKSNPSPLGLISNPSMLQFQSPSQLKPQMLDNSPCMNIQSTQPANAHMFSEQEVQNFQHQQFLHSDQKHVQRVWHQRPYHNQKHQEVTTESGTSGMLSMPSSFVGKLMAEHEIEFSNESLLAQAIDQTRLSESQNLQKLNKTFQMQASQGYQASLFKKSHQMYEAPRHALESQNNFYHASGRALELPQGHWCRQHLDKSHFPKKLSVEQCVIEGFHQRLAGKEEAHQPQISSDVMAPQSSNVTSCRRSSSNQERDYLNQRRWLLLLLHARKCPSPKGQCFEANCLTVQQLWMHMDSCNSVQCMFRGCSKSRRLLRHYIACQLVDCPVCTPVLKLIASTKKRSYTLSVSSEPNLMNVSWKNVTNQSNDNLMNKAVPSSSESSDYLQSSKRMKVLHTPVTKWKTSPGTHHVCKHQQGDAPLPSKLDTGEMKMENSSLSGHGIPHTHASNHEYMSNNTLLIKPITEHSSPKEFGLFLKDRTQPFDKEFDQPKMEVMKESKVPPTELTPGSKSCKPKIKGVSLTELFTLQQNKEHIISLRQWVGQGKAKAEKNQAAGHIMNESSCQLCAVEKLTFEPLPIYCTSCGSRIKRNSMYYTMGTSDTRQCFCILCYNGVRGDTIEVEGSTFQKSRLEKKKNDDETEESWVQCDKCEAWQHQICALFNGKRNSGGQAEYTCPYCYIKEFEKGERKPLPQSSVLGAKDLPRTILSDHLEQRLFRRLKQERQERAQYLEKSIDEVPGAEELVVRVVSSIDKKLEVKQRILEIFQEENYPTVFPYKSKVILLFQKIEGVEVCLFSMYVQEFGSECQFPNNRRVYISYLDSVKYFRPEIKTVTGEALRTFVYHEILIGYLDYCKKRGFTSCYIWACPPLKGEDYILYCHPEIQRTPKSDKLREWYLSMLRKASKEEIIVSHTNLYDMFFTRTGECKAKVTAARLPYFDGDYWPGAAEDIINQHLLEQNGRNHQKKGGTRKPITKRAYKLSCRTDLTSNASKDALLIEKLGKTISPMKEDFIMVHLQYACTHCCTMMVSGNRWTCNGCKNFQLCDKCYETEQKLIDRDRHPINSRGRHELYPIEITNVSDDTKDNDEIFETECFENRQSFLSLCQGNHYQYDTLRRAKHSSMMVLFHLHNPTAPAFVSTCYVCHNDIETGQGWHCEVCPDFAVCDLCYQKDHIGHPHKLTSIPSNASCDAQTQEARQKRILQLREMLDLLVHAAQCRSPDCKYPNCNKFRAFFRHSNICKTRASGGCFHCKKIWCILQLHARACKVSNCNVPRCRDLKKHLKRLQQQSDSRRRASMMEMIRQRAAELGNN